MLTTIHHQDQNESIIKTKIFPFFLSNIAYDIISITVFYHGIPQQNPPTVASRSAAAFEHPTDFAPLIPCLQYQPVDSDIAVSRAESAPSSAAFENSPDSPPLVPCLQSDVSDTAMSGAESDEEPSKAPEIPLAFPRPKFPRPADRKRKERASYEPETPHLHPSKRTSPRTPSLTFGRQSRSVRQFRRFRSRPQQAKSHTMMSGVASNSDDANEGPSKAPKIAIASSNPKLPLTAPETAQIHEVVTNNSFFGYFWPSIGFRSTAPTRSVSTTAG